MAENRIKKIKLSDGSVYSIFDEGSLRLDSNNRLITGNTVVDQIIIKEGLHIAEIDDVPLANVQEKVLVRDATTGEIKQQDIRQVLRNLGLITASVENDILNLEVINFSGNL